VALVNLLIAMFADTYSRVLHNAEVEYSFKKYHSVYLHQHVLLRVPPPLNIPYFVWQSCVTLLNRPSPLDQRFTGPAPKSPIRVSGGALDVDTNDPVVDGQHLVAGSLRRQAESDAASIEALAKSLPQRFERLKSFVEQELNTIKEAASSASAPRGHGRGLTLTSQDSFSSSRETEASTLGDEDGACRDSVRPRTTLCWSNDRHMRDIGGETGRDRAKSTGTARQSRVDWADKRGGTSTGRLLDVGQGASAAGKATAVMGAAGVGTANAAPVGTGGGAAPAGCDSSGSSSRASDLDNDPMAC